MPQFQCFLEGNIDNVFINIKIKGFLFFLQLRVLFLQACCHFPRNQGKKGKKKKPVQSPSYLCALFGIKFLSLLVLSEGRTFVCIVLTLLQWCFFFLSFFLPCRSLSTTGRNCALLHELRGKWTRWKGKMGKVQKKRHKVWPGQLCMPLVIPSFAVAPSDQARWLHFTFYRLATVLSLPYWRMSPWCSWTLNASFFVPNVVDTRMHAGRVRIHI